MRVAHILVCHSISPARLLASIPYRSNAAWYVFLHSSSELIAEEARRICEERGGRLYPFMCNRGLALSWNDAIVDARKDGCDAFLLLNDDLHFYDGGYSAMMEMIAAAEVEDETIALVSVRGLESGASAISGQVHVQSFACGALLARAIDKIGYFDENYVPAYFEDNDYFFRMAKAGLHVHFDERILVEHERSSTSRALPAEEAQLLQTAFERNRAYTIRKWGAENQGLFDHPFGDPAFDHRITEDRRHHPYGDHDIEPDARRGDSGGAPT